MGACCVNPAKYTSALDGPRPLLQVPAGSVDEGDARGPVRCPVCAQPTLPVMGLYYVIADNCPRCKLFWPYHLRGVLIFGATASADDIAFYRQQVRIARGRGQVGPDPDKVDVGIRSALLRGAHMSHPSAAQAPQTVSRLTTLRAPPRL